MTLRGIAILSDTPIFLLFQIYQLRDGFYGLLPHQMHVYVHCDLYGTMSKKLRHRFHVHAALETHGCKGVTKDV